MIPVGFLLPEPIIPISDGGIPRKFSRRLFSKRCFRKRKLKRFPYVLLYLPGQVQFSGTAVRYLNVSANSAAGAFPCDAQFSVWRVMRHTDMVQLRNKTWLNRETAEAGGVEGGGCAGGIPEHPGGNVAEHDVVL